MKVACLDERGEGERDGWGGVASGAAAVGLKGVGEPNDMTCKVGKVRWDIRDAGTSAVCDVETCLRCASLRLLT